MEWTRKEVKERAKEALRRNYWKVVFVSFIFIVLSGGVSYRSSSSIAKNGEDEKAHELVVIETDEMEADGDSVWNGVEEDLSKRSALASKMVDTIGDSIEGALSRIDEAGIAVIVAFAVAMAVIFIIVMLIGLALDVFLINPLWVGAQRFMLKCVDDKGNIAELGYTFDHHYLNGVKTTFMRDLYVFLWALLFIIPGIYKKYQYYMVEFILAENPDMPYKEVLERSKKMMDGQKWNAFVLDLQSCLLRRGERVIELTSIEYRLMKLFMENPGKVFTKQQLFEEGWGDKYLVSDNNIMVCISKLRSKLSEDGNAYIKTIRGLGYRLEK